MPFFSRVTTRLVSFHNLHVGPLTARRGRKPSATNVSPFLACTVTYLLIWSAFKQTATHGLLSFLSTRDAASQVNMPSELTQSIRAALNSFVASKSSDGSHLPVDILRAIQNETSNLLERQLICDTLDADPYKICEDDKDVRRQFQRLQQIVNVVSCSRTKTLEGHVSINVVVELTRDLKMNSNVKDCVRLEFAYDRSPFFYTPTSTTNDEHEGNDNVDIDNDNDGEDQSMATGIEQPHKGTRVMYSIDYSRDHGRKDRLITIEVMASADAPSSEQAIPMEDGDEDDDIWEEFDEDGEQEDMDVDERSAASKKTERHSNSARSKDSGGKNNKNSDSQSVAEMAFEGDGKDRFAAFVDPENLYTFLSCTGLMFDEATAIYFLMTFPFFEHEWDILGYLLDAVFGDNGSEDDSSSGGGDDAKDSEPNGSNNNNEYDDDDL